MAENEVHCLGKVMQFETINSPKVADVIVSQIEQLILDGVLKPGERLSLIHI